MSVPTSHSLLGRQRRHAKSRHISKVTAAQEKSASMDIVKVRVEGGEDEDTVKKELGLSRRVHHKQVNSLRNHRLFPKRAEFRQNQKTQNGTKEGGGENKENQDKQPEGDEEEEGSGEDEEEAEEDEDEEDAEEFPEDDAYDPAPFLAHGKESAILDQESRRDKPHIISANEATNGNTNTSDPSSKREYDASLFNPTQMASPIALSSSSIMATTTASLARHTDLDDLLGVNLNPSWKVKDAMGEVVKVGDIEREVAKVSNNSNSSIGNNPPIRVENNGSHHDSEKNMALLESQLDDILGL